MNAESVEKEIINWNIHTFQNLCTVVDVLHRVDRKQPAEEHDFKIRDFYFKPSFDIFGMAFLT